MNVEIKISFNSVNVSYHSVQSPLSSRSLPKNIKIKIKRTIIWSVVLYGCEAWSFTWREQWQLKVIKNRME